MSRFLHPNFYKNIRQSLNKTTTLNPVCYFDKDFFNVEQKQVFDKGWSCIGLTQQIKGHGDTFTSNLGNKPIFTTMNKDKQLNSFFNVCRHRAHTVVQKDGKYPTFMCPYHKWTYNLDGKLIKTPMFFDDYSECEKQFNKNENSLFGLRTQTIANMIFATNNSEVPNIKTLMGDLEDKLKPYNLEKLHILRQKDYLINCNWKLLQENFMEYLHLPAIHPTLNKISKVSDHLRFQGPGQYVSFITKPLTTTGTVVDPGYIKDIPNLPEFNADMALFNQIFPNVFYFLLPSHLFIVMSFPLTEDKTLEKTFLLGLKENEEERVEELWDFYDMTNIEDIDACEQINHGIRCEMYQGGILSQKYEETINRFHNIFADHMTDQNFKIPSGDDQHKVGDQITYQYDKDILYRVFV